MILTIRKENDIDNNEGEVVDVNMLMSCWHAKIEIVSFIYNLSFRELIVHVSAKPARKMPKQLGILHVACLTRKKIYAFICFYIEKYVFFENLSGKTGYCRLD